MSEIMQSLNLGVTKLMHTAYNSSFSPLAEIIYERNGETSNYNLLIPAVLNHSLNGANIFILNRVSMHT